MFKIVWDFIKLGGCIVSLFAGIAVLFSCAMLTILLVATAQVSTSQKAPYDMQAEYTYEDLAVLLYGNSTDLSQTQGLHKGLPSTDGWDYSGEDYTTSCGDLLYSPVPGTAVVTFNGYDGSKYENTEIRIKGETGEARVLHGKYSLVIPGDTVIGGVTPIGYNASIGNSSDCHSHITWEQNPEWDYLKHKTRYTINTTGKKGNYGSVMTSYSKVNLSVSHYDPSQGGINCDHDCSTMASGEKVADWTFGRDGVYAAACPQEWYFGQRFVLADTVYECQDHGGYINCYAPGDYDPAYGTVSNDYHCWVDLLNEAPYPYGYKTKEWHFLDD